jgi:hypothetical protein
MWALRQAVHRLLLQHSASRFGGWGTAGALEAAMIPGSVMERITPAMRFSAPVSLVAIDARLSRENPLPRFWFGAGQGQALIKLIRGWARTPPKEGDPRLRRSPQVLARCLTAPRFRFWNKGLIRSR